MGQIHLKYLTDVRIYTCAKCGTHLATLSSVLSRAFTGLHGRACLFDYVVNVYESDPIDRTMTTGLHTVRDIFCVGCAEQVGWKYDKAHVESQRYKEGKFILERQLITSVEE